MSPFKPNIAASRLRIVPGNDTDLTRFVDGQLITARKLREIPQAINDLETAVGLTRTRFQAFHTGSAITAGDLNQFIQPLTRLGHRLGVVPNLEKYPLKPADLITAETLNEIVDTINALKHRRRKRDSHRA